jgi:hypothetical protein
MQQKLTGSWPWDFWGRNFHVFCPCVRLFCGSVPSGFGSLEATQIADPANGRCVCFWPPGVADSHSFTRKRNGLSPQKRPAVTLACLYWHGIHRMVIGAHDANLRGPSTMSPWEQYGLAPRDITWNITWNIVEQGKRDSKDGQNTVI